MFFDKNIYFCDFFLRHFSSAVEQLTRNEQVVGSNPMSGSGKKIVCFAQYFLTNGRFRKTA